MVLKISEQLTPKQRAVFILRDLEDIDMSEVGIILSMSSGNVKSNLYYARKKMNELLTKIYQNISMDEL
jgi:RNA polymerase sigma-70 factor (ECF subfamily)